MKISPYGINVNDSRSVNQTASNLPANWPQTIRFRENFDYAEIEPEAYNRLAADETTSLLSEIFTGLIKKSLQLGLNVYPAKKRRIGDYVLEARFEPKNDKTGPTIYLPVSEVDNLVAKNLTTNQELDRAVVKYLNSVIKQTDNEALIRLIIVFAHEFGHFMSYCKGNHDMQLAEGLLLMHKDMVIGTDTFTSLVFIEESIAWKYGHEHLERLGFIWWDIFDQVKYGSLKAYFGKLQLNKASLATHYKLSLLGEDFQHAALSAYFNKEAAVTHR